jgi:hypothetical protein
MNFIREQTVGELLRSTFGIYFKHFGSMFLVTFIGLLPTLLSVLLLLAWKDLALLFGVIGYFLLLISISVFIPAASTVIVSDISLGHKPSVFRASKRVLGAILGKLFGTAFLAGLIIMFGFIIFIIPGIIFFIRYLLVSPVVILEGKWGRDALKRSKALVKGYSGRILGFYFVFFCTLFLVFFLISFLLQLMGAGVIGPIIILVIEIAIIPVGVIPLVLLYYDLRARKEGYDNTGLAEDLRR